jgi:type VI secretion system secreted protein VgrG
VGAQKADWTRQLPFEQALHASDDSLGASQHLQATPSTDTQATDTQAIGGGAGRIATLGRPDLVLAAPGGIAAQTPAHTVASAGHTLSAIAGQDLQQLAQGHNALAAKDGLVIYTYGQAQNSSKPNTETGIQLHAATGNVSTQSQTGATRLTADKAVRVSSTAGMVKVTAPKHILLTAGGAAIRIEGGNITLSGPGKVEFRAAAKELGGPKSADASVALVKPDQLKGCSERVVEAALTGGALV